MLQRLFSYFSLTSPIIQGAIGSALFWAALTLLQSLGIMARRAIGDTTAVLNRNRKIQEYVYRRFSSREGLINYVQGFQFTQSSAFRGLLSGLIFCCIAILFGGSVRFIWGVCLIAALVYFISALSWLSPSDAWKNDSLGAHWQRVAALEQELFGRVDEHTNNLAAKYAQEEAKKEVKPPAKD